jgi:UDP-glucuronate decarboxylase
MMSAGAAMRTYTYVADAARGAFTAHLCGSDLVYNVADPEGNVSIRYLAGVFAAARPDKGLELEFVNPDDSRSFSPVPSLGLDASRLQATGWKPVVPIDQGVDRTIRSYEEGPMIPDEDV